MSTMALVAHYSKKQDMVEWANYNKETLKEIIILNINKKLCFSKYSTCT